MVFFSSFLVTTEEKGMAEREGDRSGDRYKEGERDDE